MDHRQQLVESVFGTKVITRQVYNCFGHSTGELTGPCDQVDPALVARLQPALTGLDRHRFTSTDEFAVRRRWEGYVYIYTVVLSYARLTCWYVQALREV